MKEAMRTTTMFLCDSEVEAYYENYLNEQVALIKTKLSGIGTIDGLKSYILSDAESIQNILTLLGISVEKFKRVVSLIRLNKGYTFESEWSPNQLRKEMLAKPDIMNEFCDLFHNGYVSPEFSALIPRFILHDFRIDNDVVKRLSSEDYIRNLVKDKITTEYNNKYCEIYHARLKKAIDEIVLSYGLSWGKIAIPNIGKDIEAVSYLGKFLIINHQFNLTTSSGQSEYYRNTIQPLFAKSRTNPEVNIVNILDGAGWIGRSSDFKKVYTDCHYYCNLKSISLLNGIIKEHFNI